MKILLDSGKADINATTEGNADTILHILARNTWSFHDKVYIECLKLALSYSDVIVNVTERCDGMTPLAIATESTCKEAVIALLKAGKNHDFVPVTLAKTEMIYPKNVRAKVAMDFT